MSICHHCKSRDSLPCRKCGEHTQLCPCCNNSNHKCKGSEVEPVVNYIVATEAVAKVEQPQPPQQQPQANNEPTIQSSIQVLIDREAKRSEELKNQHACELDIIREQYEAQITDMHAKFELAQKIYAERAERMKATYEGALKEMEESINELQSQKNELRSESEMNTLKRGQLESKLKEMSESFKQIDTELKETKNSLPKPLSARGRSLVKRGTSSRPDNVAC